MQLPSWLIQATGAAQFANNPANGFQPTMGDALQGIGHSMMDHYRRGEGMGIPKPAGTPMSAPQNMPAPLATAPRVPPMPAQQIMPFGDPAAIMQQLQQVQMPQLSPIGSVLGRL